MNEQTIFTAALELEPSQRPAFLDEACGNSPELRQRVEKLLQLNAGAGKFMEQPAAVAVVTIDQPTERPGTQIGPYKLLQQIGEGGMGVVYMAEQHEPVKRRVALKIIKPGMDTRQVIARFEAERQALSLMEHPNIAKVLDAGTTDSGRPYFVMELVKGQPITQYCDEKHLTPRQRLELLLPVCQAIQHAHQKGIIHRDIKPTNILVAEYDQQPVPKVIDFGVAKATSQTLTEKTMFTGLGQIVGTLEYMSPEQAKVNQLDIDTRSDIYSLGVLLYELLTGSTPFDRKRLRSAAFDEMLRIIREEEPPKPSTRLSDSHDSLPSISAQRHTEPAKLTKLVRGELDWIVMKCLEKDRARRYETASAFAADLQHYLSDEPVVACPPSAIYRFRKFARRNKGRLLVASVLAVALLVAVSGVGWAVRDRSAREAEAARLQMEREAEAARQQAQRQAKVAGQAESIFAEVDQLEKEQKWPEALAAVRRAAAAVAGGEADAATAGRVRQRLRGLEFIDRLEQIRMEDGEYQADFGKQNLNYAQAFRNYGVDIDELAVEATIERLKARPALVIPIAGALDEWVAIRRVISKGDDAGTKRLVAVARGIDPEPLRDRLRSAPWPITPESWEELRRLADSIKVREHHPATLYRLAVALGGDHALRLLRDAQAAYSGDYWLNDQLGSALYEARYKNKVNFEGAIRFYTVALAIRPSAAMHNDWYLAQILHEHGDLDQAIAICTRAIESNPKDRLAPYHRLGLVLRDLKRPDEAIAVYRQAIDARPKDSVLYLDKIGETLRDQKRQDEAIAVYREAIEKNPQTAGHYWRIIADILRDEKKLAEAAEAYDKAIAAYRSAGYHDAISDILLAQGKPEEAITAYRQAIETSPKAGYYGRMANILRDQKRPAEAVDAYRKAVELEPLFGDASIELGRILIALGKPDEAIAVHRLLIKAGPETTTTYLGSIGNILREQKKLREAADAYRKAIELNPNDRRALWWYHRLGLAQRDQNKLADANATFDRAIELYRKSPDLTSADRYYNIGLVLRDKGDLDEAIAAFRKVLDIAPTNGPVIRDLADALRARGRPDEAIEVDRKAIEADPKDFDSHQALGAALVKQNKLDEAVTAYRKAAELAPNPNFAAGVYFELGSVLSRQQKRPDAIAVYLRAVELDPKKHGAAAYIGLGLLLRDWGKPDEAAASFRKAIEINDPGHNTVVAHRMLGEVLLRQNKLDEAIASFNKVIELKPESPLSLRDLAWILANRPEANSRDPKRAVELAKQAVQLDRKNGFYWQTLGYAEYRAGNWKSAITALGQVRSLGSSGDSLEWFPLAMAHWQLGEKDKAREWYDKAIEWMDKNQPNNEELRRFRAEAAELLELKEKIKDGK